MVENTQGEIARMLNNGHIQVSPLKLKVMLEELGYKIDPKMSFNYLNGSNEITYNALSLGIVEADTGLSFSHEDARRDKNFRELQNMRLDHFAVENGRIWEL